MVNKIITAVGIIVSVAAAGLVGYMFWMKITLDFIYLPGYIIGMIVFGIGIGIIIFAKQVEFKPEQEEDKREEQQKKIFHKSA